jgi:hypothetical protein
MADIAELLSCGGEGRIALLRYCVMSITPEPVFLFLVQEYRFRPTHRAALALYDVFCAPAAAARVRSPTALPPRDLRLSAAISAIRRQWAELQSPAQPEDGIPVSTTVPHRDLFDRLAAALQQDPDGPLARVARLYDPGRTPHQNLPGGTMNAAQKHFVERVWRPVARPALVVAGFWQIGNIE